jgi:hypothetical protein
MINAERYEEIISELRENVEDKEKTLELINELSKTTDVYKKSLVCDNYVKIGRLTTRNELLLDPPVVDSLDNSQPINYYYPGYYGKFTDYDFYVSLCNTLDGEPNYVKEEVNSSGGVLGYVVSLANNSVCKFVFYDQYKTGEEKAIAITDGESRLRRGSKIVKIEMPDGSHTEVNI